MLTHVTFYRRLLEVVCLLATVSCGANSSQLTVIGSDRDKETAWFIVVRRDKPPA